VLVVGLNGRVVRIVGRREASGVTHFAIPSAKCDDLAGNPGVGFIKSASQKTPHWHPTMSRILNFLRREDGPTAVEYAVMLALIIAVCIAAIGSVGNNTRQLFNDNNDKLNSAW
jgi:pilus assembly protein Flp/PilA